MLNEHRTNSGSVFHIVGKIALGAIFLFVLLGVTLSIWIYIFSETPGPSGPERVTLQINRGASFDEVSALLVEKGLVNDDIRFSILARLSGLSGKVRAGEFSLPTGRKPLQLLEELSSARVIQHRVTIAEGLRADQIAAIFAQNKWTSETEFMRLVKDRNFIAELGLSHMDSLEGYLYPDTYYLTRIPSPSTEDIVRMMVNRFKEIWKSTGGGKSDRHKTVILASIVEKETGDPSERPLIAGVFLNRLKKGMRLQSDPTVIYGVVDFNGNITRKDLRRATPYNTYVIPGLPKGPIANPGKAALEAVLSPKESKYLYFVSKNDGTHHFSATLKEHNRAVYRYQKKKKKK